MVQVSMMCRVTTLVFVVNAMASGAPSCTLAPEGTLFEHSDIFGSDYSAKGLAKYNRTTDPNECCLWCSYFTNCTVWTLCLKNAEPYTNICFLKYSTQGRITDHGSPDVSGCKSETDCVPPPPTPPPPANHTPVWVPWTSEPPVGVQGIDPCPLAPSKIVMGIDYDHHNHRLYSSADTWYPTIDTTLGTRVIRSSFMDGGVTSATGHASANGGGSGACQGIATVTDIDDPMNMTIAKASCYRSSPLSIKGAMSGRYACGQFAMNGTWFYGTYQLEQGPNAGTGCVNKTANGGFAWCRMASFVGFRTSTDGGVTWNEPRKDVMNLTDNIFGELANPNISSIGNGPWLPIKFGAPNIVDFGVNLEHSPDNKMYVVGYGSSRQGQWEEWNAADEIYLARTFPTAAAVQNRSEWEFYAGNNAWVRGNVSAARPIMVWNNRTGTVAISYVKAIDRFVMVITSPTAASWPYQNVEYDTYLAESASITGPYSLISYQKHFGPQAYFVTMPTFWIGNVTTVQINGTSVDTLEFFTSYAANWRSPWRSTAALQNPPGSTYGWNVQKTRFRLAPDWRSYN